MRRERASVSEMAVMVSVPDGGLLAAAAIRCSVACSTAAIVMSTEATAEFADEADVDTRKTCSLFITTNVLL